MKKKRQEKIIELIQNESIGTQEELADKLKEAGFPVTQATVSRDIRQLKLSKLPAGDGGQKYVAIRQNDDQLEGKYSLVLKEGFASMDMAEGLLVIRTVSGMAMAVAAALDAMEMREIVGCIAGDDTIMVALKTREDTETVMEKIRDILKR